MVTLLWRDGEPETAQIARTAVTRWWLGFVLGWGIIPHRVNSAPLDPMTVDHLGPVTCATALQELLDEHRQ